MCWIDVDYATLIGRWLHHLADLCHRSPELVASGDGPGLRAAEGFATAVAERGVAGFECLCGDGTASGYAVVERIRAERPEITGIATLNEAALNCSSSASPPRHPAPPRAADPAHLAALQLRPTPRPARG